jgi:cyanophycinase
MTADEPRKPGPFSDVPSIVSRVALGTVMPIGGGEDRAADGESEILKRFAQLSGGKRARILVTPTASEDPKSVGAEYVGVFRDLGVREADAIAITTREEANGEGANGLLQRATGVFITGGDQARLVTILGGTVFNESLQRRNAEGTVVAGTSAGASILGSHMVVGGTGQTESSTDAAARRGIVELVAGFGLLEESIIDQHFSQRGRIGRLLSAFASSPGMISLGLDEDTAAIITPDGILETVGTGMVTIIDGRSTRSDYFAREVGEVLTVVDSSLHGVGPGSRFDLQARTLAAFAPLPDGQPVEVA